MKKALKTMLLTVILSIATILPVFASEDVSWQPVIFKLAVPEGIEFNSPIYVMYTGPDTDLFAELTAENSYTAEINAVPGVYSIYQIVPTFDTEYTFMATSTLTVTNENQVINIYFRDEEGFLNADITEGDMPTDLATYGEAISKEIESSQKQEQEDIRQAQEAIANEQYEGQTTLDEALQNNPNGMPEETTANPNGRNSKITNVTATADATKSVTGLFIIGAIIVALGIVVVIIVLLRKYKKIEEEKHVAEQQNANQGSNSLSNR